MPHRVDAYHDAGLYSSRGLRAERWLPSPAPSARLLNAVRPEPRSPQDAPLVTLYARHTRRAVADDGVCTRWRWWRRALVRVQSANLARLDFGRRGLFLCDGHHRAARSNGGHTAPFV